MRGGPESALDARPPTRSAAGVLRTAREADTCGPIQLMKPTLIVSFAREESALVRCLCPPPPGSCRARRTAEMVPPLIECTPLHRPAPHVRRVRAGR
jgi:hypothetical protein